MYLKLENLQGTNSFKIRGALNKLLHLRSRLETANRQYALSACSLRLVMQESVRAGKTVDTEMHESIAEGLHGGVEKSSITLGMIRRYADDIFLVKEETIRKAIYLLWKQEKQVAEGSGAVAVALLLEKSSMFVGQTVAAVVTGANIGESLFREILSAEGN